ncbi:MAG: hypothetical protein AMJ62_02100 [Myxococcales bacterium SG8_38]|nr:MAG: hypothetical protein AMJ62_02100 [Myxococcales bacterium SG8_38]
MYFALWNDADQSAAEDTWQATIDANPLTVSRPDALVEGESYTLYYFADVDGDGTCDGPAVAMDHAWSEPIPNVSADVAIDATHNVNFDGDCSKH